MVRCDKEVKVMDNNCIHRGDPSHFWTNPDTRKYRQVLHFVCKKQMIAQQSDNCMYPDYIKDPRCCVCYEKEESKEKT